MSDLKVDLAEQEKIIPGSRPLRPTRRQAEESASAFWRFFSHFDKRRGLTKEQIGRIIGRRGDDPGQNMYRKITTQKFDDAERQKFIEYIYKTTTAHREAIRNVPDALYFALLEHCHGIETSQDNARIHLVGTYKLWRFSVEHDNEFVLGRIDIEENIDTQALKVTMKQPKKSRDGVRGTREKASGYMFRLSNMYVLMLTDELTRDLRVTIFPRSKLDFVGTDIDQNSVYAGCQEHVVHLDGFGLGVDGSTGFFSPVHLSLVDNVDELTALDGILDVVPESDTNLAPPRVVEKLRRSGQLLRL